MHEVREVVGRYAGGFDAAVVSTADAQRIVVDATAAANMLATVVALAAKRVADTEGWRSCGDASAAHHLARTSGSSVARAKAVLDTAGRLGALPALEAAARGGELSPAQVAPIADAASKAPGAEARLVASAKAVSLGELFDACARTKAAAEPDDGARHRAIHAGRFLRRRRTTDGAGELQYRSSLEEVAEIFAVVQGWSQRRFAAARAAGTRAAGEVYLADGLLDAVRASCAPMSSHRTDRVVVSGETAGGGGSAAGADRSASRSGSSGAGARPAGATGAGANGAGANGAAAGGAGVSGETPGGSRSGGYPTDAGAATAVMDRRGVGDLPSLFAHEPFPDVPAVGTPHDTGPPKPPSPAKVIVRIDWDALVRGWPVDGEVCEINGLGPVAVSAVREMIASGDAFLAAVVTRASTWSTWPTWAGVPARSSAAASSGSVPSASPSAATPRPISRSTTGWRGRSRRSPCWRCWSVTAAITTTRRPTTAGPWSKAPASGPWCLQRTPATPATQARHPLRSSLGRDQCFGAGRERSLLAPVRRCHSR